MPARRTTAALAAALLALSAPLSPAAAQQPATDVVVDAAVVRSLEARLAAFAAELPEGERAALENLKRQAAAAPADNPAGTQVRGFLHRPARGAAPSVPGATTVMRPAGESRPPMVVQSGGAAPAQGADGRRIVMQGGPPPAAGGAVVTRPGQDDPRAGARALVGSLLAFGQSLPPAEQATLDWMLQRSNRGVSNPGALPPGPCSLAQALGIVAIGPKQDDPAPPPPNTRWVLKF